MRVLFLIRCFLYYTAQLASALAQAGHDVIMIVPEDGGEFIGSGAGDIRKEFREWLDPRITLEWVHFPPEISPKTLVDNLRCVSNFVSLIRKYRLDVLHLHDVSDCRIFGAVALTKRRNPLVLTIHDAELHPGDSSNKQEFVRHWLRRMADGVIVHGDDVKNRLLAISKLPEDRIYCVPIGAYTFYRRWLSADTDSNSKKILFFGRIREYKGLEYLVKAAPIVCREVPDSKFVIAGEGPDWPRCKALIENPENFILLEGAVYDPDITKLFEESAVVAMPYIEASQSAVLTIAYALGKPVVVTNVGSLPEVVEDGVTGLLVPPRDEKALAEAIIKILTDDELRKRISQNAYRLADTHLSWDAVARQTGEVYKKVVGC